MTAAPTETSRPTTTATEAADARDPRAWGTGAAAAAPRPGPIVIATVNRPRGDTGVHTHTAMLRAGIEARGLPCALVTPFEACRVWSGVFAVRHVVLKRLNPSWSTRWYRHWHTRALYAALRRVLLPAPPAAVIAQCPLSAGAALEVRAELGGDWPIAMVCHFNHGEATEFREKGELGDDRTFAAIEAFEAHVLAAVDRVVFVSDWSRRDVESRGIRPRASSVIWNGIGDAPPAGATRAALGLADDDVVLVNVGTLEPRKDQVGLVRLFARLAPRHPRARLVLVGEGPDRGAIQRLVAQHDLADRVRLLGRRRDVPALLQAADVYVHHAALENCPVSLIEAARAALPFAAIPAGGIPELQASLGSGVALAPDDVEASAAALEPLLADAALRRALGRRGRAAFESHFTRDAMTAAYLEALGIAPPARQGGTDG